MTKITKKSTSLQETVDSTNRVFEINRRIAGRIKGKSLNINSELAHLGGVKVVIQSLNNACLEFDLKGTKDQEDIDSLQALRQLRDILIKEHYGEKTWNLIEFMLK